MLNQGIIFYKLYFQIVETVHRILNMLNIQDVFSTGLLCNPFSKNKFFVLGAGFNVKLMFSELNTYSCKNVK